MQSKIDVITYIHVETGIVFLNKGKFCERTNFFVKRASYEMDRFEKWKKWLFLKNEQKNKKRTIENCSDDLDRS